MAAKVGDFSLILKLLGGIIIGALLGLYIGENAEGSLKHVMDVVVSLRHIFGQIIFFLVPLVIVGFITPAIVRLGQNASKILLVAVANNYGLGVPRRAFMELAAEKIRKWFPEYMRTAMPGAEAGNTDINDVLETAGSVGADLVKEAIADGGWEPNAPETIKRKKGSDKPLIDTDAMRQAATWQVRDRS